MKRLLLIIIGILSLSWSVAAWPGMDMPKLKIEGRYLTDEDGNIVNLHGFGQTYSPWFNEENSQWNNYDINACLTYNKKKIDEIMAAGWKMDWIRIHMDPYWSNTPGSHPDGESDISAFSFTRFKTYLDKVFIPMAEYAISKGLYVVMRPPGVCPHDIAVGDAYHEYLKTVWGYVATVKKLTDNPYVMFELANEPVNIKDTDGQYRSNTDGCNKNLTKFFQEIVDLMREKGCENILWVPGTGYQSQYAGFAKYPVKGKNIGYAVHVYPGWYGSDAIEPSQELGGSYGGGFSSFSAGWDAQIKPVTEIAPIIVTEMDWAPSAYKKSWGKSITGKMLGEGFGANFKVLADNTGNVSWMIFTGPELLGQFKDVPGTAGKYTFFNDPDACPWPVYHWYKDYAGDALPAPSKTDVKFSTTLRNGKEIDIMTGSSVAATVISQYEGYELNIIDGVDVAVADEKVVKWEDGKFTGLKMGKTKADMEYAVNGKTQKLSLTLNSTPFPLSGGFFNPSIWETGSFNEATGEVKTGQWGFAGWQYPSGLNLSDYRYLVAEIEGDNNCSLSFRIFDVNNYWSDPAMYDFGSSKRVIVDLNNMLSNSNKAKLSPEHLYIIGFWTNGAKPFTLKGVWVSNSADGTSGVSLIENEAEDELVDVYNLQGVKLRSKVSVKDATNGLARGLYIVGNKKVAVTR